jgi:hypothetical protein
MKRLTLMVALWLLVPTITLTTLTTRIDWACTTPTWVEGLQPSGTIRASFDGRYALFQTSDGTYVQDITAPHGALHITNLLLMDSFQPVFWSPTRPQLVVPDCFGILPSRQVRIVFNLFDFSNGLEAYRTHFISTINYPGDLVGWSPSGDHLLLSNGGIGISVWSVQRQALVYEVPEFSIDRNQAFWAPTAEKVAFLAQRTGFQVETTFRLLSLQPDVQEVVYDLSPDYCYNMTGASWLNESDALILLHIPCSSASPVLDLLPFTPPQQLMRLSDNVQLNPTIPWLTPDKPVWITDSHGRHTFWQQANGHYQQMTFDPVSRSLSLQHQIARAPVFPPYIPPSEPHPLSLPTRWAEGSFVALHDITATDQQSIHLMNINSSELIPFITDVNDVGDPVWLGEEYRTVAAVYARGSDIDRRIYLAWMDTQDRVYHEFTDPRYADFKDIQWSSDGRYAVFQGFRRDTWFDVLLLDLATGQAHTLMTDLHSAAQFSFDDGVARVNFVWYNRAEEWGYSGFDWVGQEVFRVPYIDGWIGAVRTYWSPTSEQLAVLFSGQGGTLVTAGQPFGPFTTFAPGLPFWSQFAWSPNGRLLIVRDGTTEWNYYAATGATTQRVPGP